MSIIPFTSMQTNHLFRLPVFHQTDQLLCIKGVDGRDVAKVCGQECGYLIAQAFARPPAIAMETVGEPTGH
nr:hypothetical protein [Parabacteroides goldsteinii]